MHRPAGRDIAPQCATTATWRSLLVSCNSEGQPDYLPSRAQVCACAFEGTMTGAHSGLLGLSAVQPPSMRVLGGPAAGHDVSCGLSQHALTNISHRNQRIYHAQNVVRHL
mmetsp:Transcript_7304/g.15957  ORF Transcript_7304/g.15957 Transcript_7304/m.15957 type:complete len:110 (+) Transcript_7304:270-599(+)